MVGFVLKLILFLVVMRLLWRFLRGVLEGAGLFETTQPASVGLVRDPICGVFVVPSKAVTAGSGSEIRYFCSEKCREQWRHR